MDHLAEKDPYLHFYRQAQGIKDTSRMRRLLEEHAPAFKDSADSLQRFSDRNIRALFRELYQRGEILAHGEAVALSLGESKRHYPAEFNSQSTYQAYTSSSLTSWYETSCASLLARPNPFMLASVSRILDKLKRLPALEALSFEMDASKQPLLEQGFQEKQKVRVQDVGVFALLVNYGLEKKIPSYAFDNFSFNAERRAYVTANALRTLEKSPATLAHICTQGQADRIQKILTA